MANVDATASWQQYYTWGGPCSHQHSHSHPHGPATGQPHTHTPHPHLHHTNHLNQYQAGQYQQQSLAESTANASAHYSTSQQYHLQLQPGQTSPLHQQQQFHPVRGQTASRRAPYDRPGIETKFLYGFLYARYTVRHTCTLASSGLSCTDNDDNSKDNNNHFIA